MTVAAAASPLRPWSVPERPVGGWPAQGRGCRSLQRAGVLLLNRRFSALGTGLCSLIRLRQARGGCGWSRDSVCTAMPPQRDLEHTPHLTTYHIWIPATHTHTAHKTHPNTHIHRVIGRGQQAYILCKHILWSTIPWYSLFLPEIYSLPGLLSKVQAHSSLLSLLMLPPPYTSDLTFLRLRTNERRFYNSYKRLTIIF